MTIQSILALTDFSSPAENGLERAARIACSHQARLVLMYSAEEPNAKLVDPLTRLAQRARQLARRYNIQVEALTRSGEVPADVVAQTRHTDLLVIDHREHRSWRRFWRSTVLDHLLQRSHCPVLVVKTVPVQAYARMLVTVNFSKNSQELVRYADGFEATAELELFHAVMGHSTSRLRLADVSKEAIAAYEQATHLRATQRMLKLTDSFDTRRNRVMAVVGRGDPARQAALQQEAIQADLLVVGKKPHTPVLDFLFDGVTQRLLRCASSDILVVPHNNVPLQRPERGNPRQGITRRLAEPARTKPALPGYG